MLMLALGDSITYGYGATVPENSYAQRLKAQFSRHARVSMHIQAKPGWTSQQLLKSLRDVPSCIFDEAEIVTLMIGGNDLLKNTPVLFHPSAQKMAEVCEKSRSNIEAIIDIANRAYNTFTIATLYNPFPRFDVANSLTSQFNDMIRSIAVRHRLLVAETGKLYRGREADYVENFRTGSLRDVRLFGNPVHPTDEGHAAIYRAFYRTLQRARQKGQRRRVVKQRRRAQA